MSLANRRPSASTAARSEEAAEAVSPVVAQERATEASVTAIMAAPVTTIAKPSRFRVWPHGGLRHDGMFFAPGEELPMSEAEIAACGIACVELIPEG